MLENLDENIEYPKELNYDPIDINLEDTIDLKEVIEKVNGEENE